MHLATIMGRRLRRWRFAICCDRAGRTIGEAMREAKSRKSAR